MTRKMDQMDGGPGSASGTGGGMPPDGKAVVAAAREQRLKVALKANMARRKAQAKARNAGAADRVEVEGATVEEVRTAAVDVADRRGTEAHCSVVMDGADACYGLAVPRKGAVDGADAKPGQQSGDADSALGREDAARTGVADGLEADGKR